MKKGLIQVYTGDGKGKSTAAFGLTLRALGRGFNVVVVQFLKAQITGELLALKEFQNLKVIRVNKSNKFTWEMNESELELLKQEMENAYEQICQLAQEQSCDLLVLDEINHVIKMEYFTKEQIMDFLQMKPDTMEVVLTGRNAPDWLMERVDLVTEMKCIKHPMEKGVLPRKGIEN